MPSTTLNQFGLFNKVIVNNKEIQISRLLNFKSINPNKVIGREVELKNILENLENKDNSLLTTGIGGVGKSALASLVGTKLLEQNYTVLYLAISTSLQTTASDYKDILSNNEDIISLTKTIKDAETGSDYPIPIEIQDRYRLIKNTIINIPSPKLLILDDVTKDWLKKNTSQIKTDFGDWDILATSRDGGDYADVGFKKIILDNLTEGNATKLFENIFNENQSELPNSGKIQELVKILGGHALSVTFFASLLSQDMDLEIDQVLEKLKQGLNFGHKNIDLEYRNLSQTQLETVMKLALGLSKLKDFTESQQEILIHFRVLPSEFVEYKKYKEILELSKEIQGKDKFRDLQTDFDFLVKYSFLEKQGASFKMHKIMQLAISDELKVDLDNCKDSIVGLCRYFNATGGKEDFLLFVDIPLGQSVIDYFNIKKLFDENLSALLNNLAGVYEPQGKYLEAEKLFLQVKKWWEDREQTKHPKYASTLNNLAGVYGNQGKYPEAEKLYLQALEIGKRTVGENNLDYVIPLSNLANVYKLQGKYPEAKKLYLEVKKWWEDREQTEHPNYAWALNNLAGVYKSQGEYLEAEKIFLQVIEIDKNTIGENHPNYGIRLTNLGILYYDWFEKEKDTPIKDRTYQGEIINLLHLAKQNLEIALKIGIEKLGNEHPHTKGTQALLNKVNEVLGDL
jgi:tetratricopeptide (TPR) repeat protein